LGGVEIVLICQTTALQDGKPLLKVDFSDFGFLNKQDNYFLRLLRHHYTVELSDKPDLLFYSDTGHSHLHKLYTCKKVFWTGESNLGNFNECDYAMTPRRSDDPRHMRLPYYVLGCECDAEDLIKTPGEAETILNEKRSGCSVVISNAGRRAQYRVEFFHKLKDRVPVKSGGRSFNNVGGPIPPGGNAKNEFLRSSRFNLCFENKSIPGYVTEKIVEAMWARCIPIYWGDPEIVEEFNPKSFINVHDFPSEEACLKRIEEIENDDEAYGEMLKEPYFHGNTPNKWYQVETYADFLRSAAESDITPVSRKKRGFHLGRYRFVKRMRD
jgi:hypothetical protein